MEGKILDCVGYIKSISKQKVTSERIFLYMEKSDESVSEEETQKMIATLISLHELEERGIGTKSYFIPSLIRKRRLWTRISQASKKWKHQ